MVILPASTAVDHECQPWSHQIKDYEFGMCCFSTKHVLSRSKDKDCLARMKIMCRCGTTIRLLFFEIWNNDIYIEGSTGLSKHVANYDLGQVSIL